MTEATNVFDNNTTTTSTTNANETSTLTTTSYTSDLVGDDKKFKTVADLEKGKVESDDFIVRLQHEAKELREDLAKRATIEEAMEQLKNTSQSTEGDTNSTVDAEQLSKLVAEQVDLLDKTKNQTSNVTQANDKLVATYGDKAGEVLAQKANDLGVSVEFLKSTAATSPTAFYNLIGLQTTDQNISATSNVGNVNTAAMNSMSQSNSKDWAYYETMRRDDPRTYHTPAVQQEMFIAQKEGRLN